MLSDYKEAVWQMFGEELGFVCADLTPSERTTLEMFFERLSDLLLEDAPALAEQLDERNEQLEAGAKKIGMLLEFAASVLGKGADELEEEIDEAVNIDEAFELKLPETTVDKPTVIEAWRQNRR